MNLRIWSPGPITGSAFRACWVQTPVRWSTESSAHVSEAKTSRNKHTHTESGALSQTGDQKKSKLCFRPSRITRSLFGSCDLFFCICELGRCTRRVWFPQSECDQHFSRDHTHHTQREAGCCGYRVAGWLQLQRECRKSERSDSRPPCFSDCNYR